MASPSANSTTAEGDDAKKNLEQITFRFCSECANMLYPKEDEDSHKLQFTCRTCQFTEEATSTCVFRYVANNAAGETAGVTQDVGSDPTVRNHHHHFSSFNPAPEAPEAVETAERSLAVCLRCGVTLLHCNRCQDPASVEDYNHYVMFHPDFAASKALDYIRQASYFNAMDADGRDAWDARFASCKGFNMPHLSQDGIAQYLSMDVAVNPDADPPEALGIDQEEYTYELF
ncbi:hypothetical protein SLS62_008178 [Diatrype stigma]|uniref:DNA-directed RNA polymerase II subunit RPB9-like zinc ribbon domain-containing protein n=1 Tax=Diatrype stigma TaxID=117547 RepID=A0AAN9YNV8_9PEZI